METSCSLDWAITTANLNVIIGICRIYPEAALKNFDSNYMLPIHKICLNGGNFEVLKALVEGCPDLLITGGKACFSILFIFTFPWTLLTS